MILILRILFAFLRLKEVVSCEELEDSAGERPKVGRLVIVSPKNDLWRAILASLDNIRELVVDIAGVSHVDELNCELHLFHFLDVILCLQGHFFIPFSIAPQSALGPYPQIFSLLSISRGALRMHDHLLTSLIIGH